MPPDHPAHLHKPDYSKGIFVMTTYNPIKQAAAAAWAELSSKKATDWYTDRFWDDSFTTWVAMGNLFQAIIQLGIFCCALVEDWWPSPEQNDQLEFLSAILAPEPSQPSLEPTEDDAKDAADTGEFIGIEVYLDQEPPELPTVDINKKGNLEVVQQFEADAVVTSPKSKAPRPKTNRSSAKKPPTSRRKSSGTAEK
jgi:hypothetical protein